MFRIINLSYDLNSEKHMLSTTNRNRGSKQIQVCFKIEKSEIKY